jgi:manganese/zinc/iron transport system substrate-binding protein
MKWRNFIYWLLGAVVGVASLCGCAARSSQKVSSDKKKVLSTIGQIGDLVAEIGGDRIQSEVLVKGELNPHSYELVKGDDEKFLEAQAIFYNGLGLEHGASVHAMIAAHPNKLAVGEEIRWKRPDMILRRDGVVDPHIWMDVALWSEGVEPIAEKLCEVDPAGADIYRARARALKEKMEQTHQAIYRTLQAIPAQKRYLVTSHDAFHYFTRSYLADPGEVDWQKRFAAPEGLAPDGQLNPVDLQKIVRHLAEHQIEVLFPESNVSRDSIRKIAAAGKQMGIKIQICEEPLYGDALRGSYLEAMEHNARTIAHRLRGT